MKSCVHISREISIQRTETARSKLSGLCPHTQSPGDLFLCTTGWVYFSLPMCSPSSLRIACMRHLACAATISLFLNTFLIFQFTFRCTIVWYWQWPCVVGRSTSILHAGTSVQLPQCPIVPDPDDATALSAQTPATPLCAAVVDGRCCHLLNDNDLIDEPLGAAWAWILFASG